MGGLALAHARVAADFFRTQEAAAERDFGDAACEGAFEFQLVLQVFQAAELQGAADFRRKLRGVSFAKCLSVSWVMAGTGKQATAT